MAGLFALALTTAGMAAETWDVNVWNPPFDYTQTPVRQEYQPLEKAKKSWRICASYPHLKDSYWLSVNYGMVEHAKRLGVRLKIVEAGGYPNLDRQIAQIRDCSRSADTLIVGPVSYGGLTPAILDIAKLMPVIGTVNDIDSRGITAKSGDYFYP